MAMTPYPTFFYQKNYDARTIPYILLPKKNYDTRRHSKLDGDLFNGGHLRKWKF